MLAASTLHISIETINTEPQGLELSLTAARLDILTLSNEVFLKLLEKLEVEQVIRGQGLFSHHRLHCLDILADGVTGILRHRDMQTQVKHS